MLLGVCCILVWQPEEEVVVLLPLLCKTREKNYLSQSFVLQPFLLIFVPVLSIGVDLWVMKLEKYTLIDCI